MSIPAKSRRHIFALARELGLDNDERKHIQKQVTGKDSTSSMTPLEAGRMIDHLRKLRGPGRRHPKRIGRVPNTLNREPQLQKIEAQLADMGLSWEYAASIAWRITGGKGEQPNSNPGVQRLEWVSYRDLAKVIAALHVEQKKRAGLARVERELQRLGRDMEWLEEQVPVNWKGQWQRNTKRLDGVVTTLCSLVRDDEATAIWAK